MLDPEWKKQSALAWANQVAEAHLIYRFLKIRSLFPILPPDAYANAIEPVYVQVMADIEALTFDGDHQAYQTAFEQIVYTANWPDPDA